MPTVLGVILHGTLNLKAVYTCLVFSHLLLARGPYFVQGDVYKYHILHASNQASLNLMCHCLALHGTENIGFNESEFAA